MASSKSAAGTVKVRSVVRVVGDDLNDHVDIDVGFGERHEDRGGDAGPVGDAAQSDLRLVLGIGDAGDDLLFHDILLVADERARLRIGGIVEARSHEGLHLVHHGEFDRAHLQNLGAERSHFEHFLEGDAVEPTRLRHDPRIGRIDAVDIGIDVAAIGIERRRRPRPRSCRSRPGRAS